MRIRLHASLLGASLALTSLTIPGLAAPQDPAVQTSPTLALPPGPLIRVMPIAGIDRESRSDDRELDGTVEAAAIPSEDIATAEDAEFQQSIQRAAARAEADDFTPMTDSERLNHYLTDTFGPKALAVTAASAELNQLRSVPLEWGKRSGKYGVRFGSAFAQHIVQGALEYGISAPLHEDNRYHRSDRKGFWKRTGHAVSSTFLARHANGRRSFSFSRIGSAAGAGLISRAWLPHSVATVGAGVSSAGLTVAFDVGANMFREFWPDLKRRFRRN